MRNKCGIKTAAVGMIIEANQANSIIAKGEADLVCMARELLRDPHFPLRAAHQLGKNLLEIHQSTKQPLISLFRCCS